MTELSLVIKHPVFYTGFVGANRYVLSYERDGAGGSGDGVPKAMVYRRPT